MLFDSELLYTIKTDYSPNCGFNEHTHTYWQLMYVLDGERDYVIEDVVYSVKPEDCIIFKPGQRHSLKSGKDRFLVVDIKFIVNNKDKHDVLSSMNNLISCSDKMVLYQMNIMLSFLHMNSVEDDSVFYLGMDDNDKRNIPLGSNEAFAIDACLNTILLQLIRMHYMSKPTRSKGNDEYQEVFKEKIAGNVDRYLRTHYKEHIALDELAISLGYNKNYLCQEFKRQTGKSIFEYLYEVRLDAAKKLLKLSDHTIESIAEKNGFGSVNHFNRSFKKKFGETPGQYRKKAAADLWRPVFIKSRDVNMEEMKGSNLKYDK